MPFESVPSGFAMGGMPGGARSFHFSSGGGPGGFSFSDPSEIFSSFFKGGGMGDDGDIFSTFGDRRGGGFSNGSRGSKFRDSRQRASTPEVSTVERPLNVTLDQLFKGTKKKMNIKRKIFDPATGKRKMEDKMLEIDIKPGYKAGTKIKFKGWGDQEEGGTQDLHFIVTEVYPSRYFLANSNDRLICFSRRNILSSSAKVMTCAELSKSPFEKL